MDKQTWEKMNDKEKEMDCRMNNPALGIFQEEKKGKNVVIVAAHPDDETLGCGGTIAKHVQAGDKVSVLILGQGIASRGGDSELIRREVCDLEKRSMSALATLGVVDVKYFGLPDNEFDKKTRLEIIKKINYDFSERNAEIVYTHHWNDLNIDHRITYEVVMAICRPQGGTVKEIRCFEVPSATGWFKPSDEFVPNIFVDITNEIKLKSEALMCYGSELRPYPHIRSLTGVQNLAKYRGNSMNLEFAEAFMLVRKIT